nr:MAG TPA: hypothetical protein [Caudoviricetes sp.]
MSRLIDADKIIDSLGGSDMDFAIGAVIDEQPTVFDVDKVIEALEQEKSELKRLLSENVGTGYEFASKCRLDTLIKAIKIVKGGGVE